MVDIHTKFAVFSYKNRTKRLNELIQDITAANMRLLILEDELPTIQQSADMAGNRINLFVQNLLIHKNIYDIGFDYKEHTAVVKNNYLYIYSNAFLDKLFLRIQLTGKDEYILTDLPKYTDEELCKVPINKKQGILFIDTAEKYCSVLDIMEQYSEEYSQCQQFYEDSLDNIKEQLTKCPIVNLSDKSRVKKCEPYDEKKHNIFTIRDLNGNTDVVYVRKKDKDAFLDYISSLNL